MYVHASLQCFQEHTYVHTYVHMYEQKCLSYQIAYEFMCMHMYLDT